MKAKVSFDGNQLMFHTVIRDKPIGGWVWRSLLAVTVSATFPLLPATASDRQTCDPNSLHQAIEQFQNSQNRLNAQKTLQQCGEVAVEPLASALSADATTRLYAAKTLGQLGWEAKSAVPDLVSVSQGDAIRRCEAMQCRH